MTRVCSIFSQMLQLMPRLEFESAVRKHDNEHHALSFNSCDQLFAMFFCLPGHAQSSREICGGLAANEGKLCHLVLPASPAHCPLACANEHQPWRLVILDIEVSTA